MSDKLKVRMTFDERIEELASAERYEEKVKHMSCLLGIKTHTAL